MLLGREAGFLRSKETTTYTVAQTIAIIVSGKDHEVKYRTSINLALLIFSVIHVVRINKNPCTIS